jgi:hypothetical protein
MKKYLVSLALIPIILSAMALLSTVALAQEGDVAPVESNTRIRPEGPQEPAATMPVLRRGSFGPVVESLQLALQARGYDTGKPDGDFGPRTEKAVIAFQKDHYLTPDGTVDQDTWKAIFNADIKRPMPERPLPYSTEEQVEKLANDVGLHLIGKTETDAQLILILINEILAECGIKTQLETRVYMMDGKPLPLVQDYKVNRINLAIKDGKIVGVDIG